MFSLEQSIAEWRRQMLAAGIQSPVPLEELESHLREEIEAQVRSGKIEQEAFETTVLHIGRGRELQTEFSKEWEWRDVLRGNMSKTQKRILFGWIVFCLLGFISVYEKHIHSPVTMLACALLIISLAIIAVAAYVAGIFWSKFLVNTTKRVRSIIRGIANLSIFLLFIPMIWILTRPSLHFHEWLSILYIPSYFNLFTISLLESRPPSEPKNATK
jgi:hypothetical protein